MGRTFTKKHYSSHDFVKAFIKASQSQENPAEKQAEVIIETIYAAQDNSMEDAATKGDIELLKKDITEVRNELKGDVELLKKDIVALEQSILLKVGKMVYISTGLIITAIGIAVAIIKV